jgi:hypothetical protein
MSSKREDLNIDFDDLDLENVVNTSSKKNSFSDEEKKAIAEASENAGFPSRQAKASRRKRIKSPYTEQLGFKARAEVKAVFQELSDSMAVYDHTTFEMAVIALLEKQGNKKALNHLKKIINHNS